MAAWGYEFYLVVLKVSLTRSLTRERYFQHSKIKFVSPRGHVIASISFICYRKALNIIKWRWILLKMKQNATAFSDKLKGI